MNDTTTKNNTLYYSASYKEIENNKKVDAEYQFYKFIDNKVTDLGSIQKRTITDKEELAEIYEIGVPENYDDEEIETSIIETENGDIEYFSMNEKDFYIVQDEEIIQLSNKYNTKSKVKNIVITKDGIFMIWIITNRYLEILSQ